MEVSPGYMLTEVGVIPEDWKIAPFAVLGSVIDGDRGVNYPGSRDFASDGHCLFLNAGNVTRAGFRFTECAFVSREKDERLSKGKLKRNDIVLTTRGTVGNFAYFDEVVPFKNMRINSGMVILRNESAAVDTNFLYRLLQSHILDEQVERLTFGSAQPQLTVKAISTFLIVVPPFQEQLAIATALSAADELLSGLDSLITKKRDLKLAAMNQLLTGQTRLPGYQGEWAVRSLGELAMVSKGTQLRSSDLDEAGQFAHLNGGTTPSGYTSKSNTNARTIAISEGGNSCGYVQFMEQPYWCGGHCYSVIPNTVKTRFLYQALKAQQPAIMALRVGSGLPNVQKTALKAFKVKIPISADEQTMIAEILSNMDAELTVLQARRAKTSALKQAMMQELLTGRTRLI